MGKVPNLTRVFPWEDSALARVCWNAGMPECPEKCKPLVKPGKIVENFLYNFLIDDDDDFNQRHTKKSLITIQEKR